MPIHDAAGTMPRFRPTRCRVAIAMVLASMAGGFSGAAIAQSTASSVASGAGQSVTLDIPAQDMNGALLLFADQAGSQVLFDPSKVAGMRSTAVAGSLTLVDALTRMLSGSGLLFELVGENQFRVFPAMESSTGSGGARLEPMVVTASGFEQELRDAPASISIITREEIENKQFKSLHDAIETVPGVHIIGGTDGEDSGLSLRGMERGQTLVLVDGRRMNSSEANPRGGGGDIDSNWVPPVEAIERIEVVRGPMSSLYGADAVGGVVNVITRRVAEDWQGSVRLSQMLQDRSGIGDQDQADVYLAGPVVSDRVGLQVWGYQKNRDEDDVLEGVQESEKTNLTGRLWFTPNEDHDIMLELGAARQDYSRSAEKSGDGEQASRRYDRDSWALEHNGRYQDGTSRVQLYQETTERTSALVDNPVPTNATNTVFDARYTGYRDEHIFTLGYQFTETESDKSDFKDLSDPDSEWGRRKVSQSAYYAEDEWSVADDLTITGGLRLTDHEVYGNNLSPRLYAVWHQSAAWTIKGGVGTGFKAPEIREIEPGTGAPQQRGRILAFGNPDLEPEESTSYEIGFYFDNRSTFRGSATLFYNDFQNKIINTASYEFYYANGRRVPSRSDCTLTDPTTTACPAWGTWLNLPGATVRGLELDGAWDASESLQVTGGYTWSDSKISAGDLSVTAPNGESIPFRPGGFEGLQDQPLAGVPEHAANVTVTWTPRPAFSAFVRGAYESELTNVSFGQGNSVRNQPKSLTTFDVGASWRVNETFTLGAVLYNVTDEVRYDPSLADDSDLYQYPEDGRRLWLNLAATF